LNIYACHLGTWGLDFNWLNWLIYIYKYTETELTVSVHVRFVIRFVSLHIQTNLLWPHSRAWFYFSDS